jgi:hypothetical protein
MVKANCDASSPGIRSAARLTQRTPCCPMPTNKKQREASVPHEIQIGYMNVHHQRVVARARVRGHQHLQFVVWCSRCRTGYVAAEGAALTRRCPFHDQGEPTLAADSPTVEWVSHPTRLTMPPYRSPFVRPQ